MTEPPVLTLALAGDTMLGRGVGERLAADPRAPLVAPEVRAAAQEADLFVLNLECCISERGERFPDPTKPFFFRAPPIAAERLADLGVDCVTLANNHALDYGPDALLDTLALLEAAGVGHVGAGSDARAARAPGLLEHRGRRLRVVAATDHPAAYAATPERPGVAFAELWQGEVPEWLRAALQPGPDADAVLATPHWGPNMTATPVPHVRSCAAALLDAGASLIAGHSAHVFQGVQGPVLYDLGDFLDDYRVDARLRNDLGLLWLVELEGRDPRRLEALPLKLDYAYTRAADGADAAWVQARFAELCGAFGTEVRREGQRLVVSWGAE